MRTASCLGLVGCVEMRDGCTGQSLWRSANEVLPSGQGLVMDFLRGRAVAGIKLLAIEDEVGEIWRCAPANVADPSPTERVYEFYLTEDEPPDPPQLIKHLKLMADDATEVLDTGTVYAKVTADRQKKVNQSLTILWTISVAKG